MGTKSIIIWILSNFMLVMPTGFKYFFTAILAGFICLGTSSAQSRPAYLLKIDSKKDFDILKGDPLSKNFNGIECVKIVYVLATKKLYYLDSKRYKWHYPFVTEVLNDTDDLEQFNLKNYSNTNIRNYVLATFNYNVNTKNYFLQFAACDNPTDELINTLTTKVEATFFKKNEFKLLLNSTVLLRRKRDLEKKHKIVTGDELYKDQTFQPICVGKTTGILKYVHADSLKQSTNYSNCVLLLYGNSNEIPVCKAVITNEFQTPLSHICLLTNNRKTPCAAQRNIFNNDTLRKLANKMVEVIVDNEKVIIKGSNAQTAKNKKPAKLIKLNADTTIKEITDLEKLRYKQKIAFGSKVCNLAELKRVKYKDKLLATPEKAFAIPFHYYAEHIKKNGIDIMISSLLADSVALKNDSILDKRLKKIQSAIKKAPINNALLQKVNLMCSYRFGTNKTRFRSSSNCEDEANFNGAGLYTSATGIVADTNKRIEKAIKKVWASLWNARAFKERAFFNIDHSTVYMAVLVHPAFDNELVNGVAVTKNLYRSYDFGFVINMQKGEEEVVSPKPGMVCEQVISYMNNNYADFYNKNRSADWISYSGINSTASLLTADELMQLTLQLERIKKYFYDLYNVWSKKEYKNFAMDVEFKLIEGPDKKRTFLFKQARPYNN